MIIQNKKDCVIVLKAIGQPALRLFPGFNTVDRKNLDIYFKNNPAAQGMAKENLTILPDGAKVSKINTQAADAAKEKNDLMNKAQGVIQNQETVINEQKKQLDDQAAETEKLKKQIAAFEKKLAKKPVKKSGKGK